MRSKLKLSRGPLRWWIMVAGLLLVRVDQGGFFIGTGLVTLGAALHIWSKAALWQNRQLSTDGPYRFTRNPFYLANLLIDGGLLVIIGRWEVALPAAVAWVWVYHRAIAREEACLVGLFGEEFHTYRRRVPRWIPRPWRYLRFADVRGPRWTWRNPNLITGKEWTRACRVMMCPWLLLTAAALRHQNADATRWFPLALGISAFWLLSGEFLAQRRLATRSAS